MASIIEYQELKQHIFSDPNEFQVFEELLGAMELPTPPLSPDHAEAADSSQLAETTNEDLDVGESLMQMMAAAEDIPFDSQSSYGSDSSDILDINPSLLLANDQAILKDCMWNCDAYEPRHSIGCNSTYPTPAPSPPSQHRTVTEEEDEEEQVFECAESKPGEDCISPNEVLVLVTAEGGVVVKEAREEAVAEAWESGELQKPVLCYRKGLSTGITRLHPQATKPQSISSESEEEIDVVTISDRPEKLNRTNPRKRPALVSTPCSRQPSPLRILANKKRRCHSKRTHRLSSVGSNYGDGLESDDEQRRASHNVLERKRRNDLKYSFQILRGQIPELKDNQRAPKVTILRKAAEYIKQIREEDEDQQARMAKERRRESKLLQRLAYLKSLA